MNQQQNFIKRVSEEAKKIRKKSPEKKWTECIKEASKKLKKS